MFFDKDATAAIMLTDLAKEAYERGDMLQALLYSHEADKKKMESLTKAYDRTAKAFDQYKNKTKGL